MKDEILAKALSTDTEIIPRYDIVRPDGTKVAENAELVLKNRVEQEGTPYSKASMLTDETAAKIWRTPPADPDVDDALSALSDTFKVGDIKTTVRTDLGDDWLLCNGDVADAAEYPELTGLLPPAFESIEGWPEREIDVQPTSTYNYGTIYVDGCWYSACAYTATPYAIYILRSNNLKDNSWELIKTLTYAEGANSTTITFFKFRNGYFLIGSSGYLLYTKDPASTWEIKIILGQNNPVHDVEYGNGIWCCVAGGGYYYAYTAEDIAGDWKRTADFSNFPQSPQLAYGNGIWIMTTTNSSYPRLYYSEGDLTTWNYVDFDYSTRKPVYENGYFVVNSGSNYYYSQDGKNFLEGAEMQDGPYKYANGYWISCRCYSSNSSTGLYVNITKSDGAPTADAPYKLIDIPVAESVSDNDLEFGNHYLVLTCNKRIRVCDINNFALPTIATEGAYDYIRAR